MHLLWMIIVGVIVGALAKLIMPGRDPGGIIVTMLLGIGGSLLAGLLGRAVGWYQPGEPAGFISSVIGAIIIGVLNNGLVLLNVSPFWQQVVKGGVILLAVVIDKLGDKKE